MLLDIRDLKQNIYYSQSQPASFLNKKVLERIYISVPSFLLFSFFENVSLGYGHCREKHTRSLKSKNSQAKIRTNYMEKLEHISKALSEKV